MSASFYPLSLPSSVLRYPPLCSPHTCSVHHNIYLIPFWVLIFCLPTVPSVYPRWCYFTALTPVPLIHHNLYLISFSLASSVMGIKFFVCLFLFSQSTLERSYTSYLYIITFTLFSSLSVSVLWVLKFFCLLSSISLSLPSSVFRSPPVPRPSAAPQPAPPAPPRREASKPFPR